MTVNAAALGQIHAELEWLYQRCKRQLEKRTDAQAARKDMDERVRAILSADTDAFSTYDRIAHGRGAWWKVTGDGYVDPTDADNFRHLQFAIQAALDLTAPGTPALGSSQFYFSAGEQLKAVGRLYDCMKAAKASVTIIDVYLDDAVFPLVDSIDPAIKITFITKDPPKPIFELQLKNFRTKGRSADAFGVTGIHDRFLVIDDTEVWHMGTSVNTAGKDAFMVQRVVDPNAKAAFDRDLRSWLSSGKPL